MAVLRRMVPSRLLAAAQAAGSLRPAGHLTYGHRPTSYASSTLAIAINSDSCGEPKAQRSTASAAAHQAAAIVWRRFCFALPGEPVSTTNASRLRRDSACASSHARERRRRAVWLFLQSAIGGAALRLSLWHDHEDNQIDQHHSAPDGGAAARYYCINSRSIAAAPAAHVSRQLDRSPQSPSAAGRAGCTPTSLKYPVCRSCKAKEHKLLGGAGIRL